jgi:hypothetical protein
LLLVLEPIGSIKRRGRLATLLATMPIEMTIDSKIPLFYA